MKEKKLTLKSRNAPYAIAFTVLCYVGFALANGFNWSFAESMSVGKEGVVMDNPLLTAIFFILTLVLTYLFPSHWKHRLIYLRWKNPLPGSRAFSDLLDEDDRLSREQLVAQNGPLPECPKEQNALWYQIYKTKQKDPVVLNSHGRWLLFRDFFAIGLILFAPSTAYTFWYSGAEKGVVFLAIASLVVSSMFVCARNTGERFTCNVLAR